jgi:alanine dehydrogenase
VQDADYEASGAKIGKVGDAFGSDIVLKVRLQMSRFQDCFNTLQTPAHAALW